MECTVKRLTACVAAKLLGTAPSVIYWECQQGAPYAITVPPRKKGGRYNYVINPRLFAEYKRLSLAEVEAAQIAYNEKIKSMKEK